MDWLFAQTPPTPSDLEWVDTVATVASRLGVPGGVAGSLYLVVRVGRWLQPWAEKLFTAHLELVESLKAWQKVSAETQALLVAKTDATHAAIVSAARAAEKIGRQTPHAEVISEHAREIREALE